MSKYNEKLLNLSNLRKLNNLRKFIKLSNLSLHFDISDNTLF